MTPNCSFNTSLSCRALDLWKDIIQEPQINTVSESRNAKPIFVEDNGDSEEHLYFQSISGTFDPYIHYSIFIPENQTWVHCNETFKDGKTIQPGNRIPKRSCFHLVNAFQCLSKISRNANRDVYRIYSLPCPQANI